MDQTHPNRSLTHMSGPSPRRRPALVRLIPDQHETDAFFGRFFVQGRGDRRPRSRRAWQTFEKIVTRADPMEALPPNDSRPGHRPAPPLGRTRSAYGCCAGGDDGPKNVPLVMKV